MTFKRGMRRLALFVGVLGAIAGGLASYFDLQSLLEQRERHNAFERFANSAVVQAERKRLQAPDPFAAYGGKTIKSGADPKSTEGWVVSDSPVPPPPPGFILDHSDVNKGGIKSLFWANNYEVKSLETEDGQSLFPEPAPSFWLYPLAATFPFLGFLAPWGLVSALIWVGAGFVDAPR